MQKKFSKLWYAVVGLVVLNLLAMTVVARALPGDYGKVYFFNVGQGDATYFRTAQGNDVLIDGGPSDVILSKLGQVLPFFDRTIELMILTHPHADHATGLIEVMKRYKVEKVLVSDVDYDSATYREFQKLIAEKGIEVYRPKLGERIWLDQETVMDIFYPVTGVYSAIPKDANDVSTVARISFGRSHVLLTADASKEIESQLVAWSLPLSSEILKVGHQGSKTSSGEVFLEQVHPDYGVIMVGKNSYGHPHQQTLDIFSQENIPILRTDKGGDVEFILYPDRIILKN